MSMHPSWPALPLAQWQDSYATLHMWAQIVGKVQLKLRPYVNHWWKPGHAIGYEHSFIHTIVDFVNACVDRKPAQPTFEDGLKNQRVLQAVEDSVKTGKWVKL